MYGMEFTEIRGFGVKRSETLKKNGIETVSDLLTVFPYSYVNLNDVAKSSVSTGKGVVTLFGKVAAQPTVKYIRKGLFLTTVVIVENDGTEFECGWFNRKYIKNSFPAEKEFYIIGKIEKYGKKLSVSNPITIPYTDNMPNIYPLYRPIKGIPSNVFLSAMDAVLKNVQVNSFIDRHLAEKFGLTELNEAFFNIHRPSDMIKLEQAKQSVAIENLSCNMALYSVVKQSGSKSHKYCGNIEILNEFLNDLSFELTYDQRKALSEIVSDMNSKKKMNRLLQGDVGCGKTVVALSAMLYAAISGFQSVLMSPTELLALQHFETAKRLFSKYNLKIVYLSSSLNAGEKRQALSDITCGNANIIIGTHSLIREDVIFKNLSLIITDEQQRFGVNQRGALENKALSADYLIMTATPIPRTLALTLYGDLDQSEIKTLPTRKAKTDTRFVPNGKIKDMLSYIKNKADAGEQTYMVCSRIDDDELVSVNNLYEYLQKTPLKKYVGILHGQLSDNDKEAVMSRFASGDIKVLVSTSIVEVGIDVPQATTIVIFNADRYGLSQLHQLRGRVGRGDKDSFCFLLSDQLKDSAKQRIEYFISCNDGFSLADYDFKQRGAGDFLGTRQHGDSVYTNINKDLIDKAREISSFLVQNDNFKNSISQSEQTGKILFVKSLTMN